MNAEAALVVLLRCSAALLVLAFFAVLLPTDAMAWVHAGMGLGDLPRGPVVEYLTRSLSAVYGGWGLVYFVLASDVRRYLPVILFLGRLGVVLGLGLVALDVYAGMPAAWTIVEGVSVLALSAAQWWLSTRVGQTT